MKRFHIQSVIVGILLSLYLYSCGDDHELGLEDGPGTKNETEADSTKDSKDSGYTDIESWKESLPPSDDLDQFGQNGSDENEPDDGELNDQQSFPPTGEIVDNGTLSPVIIKGYPYMIIYGGDFCSWCTYLEQKKVTPNLLWFKGRVHVYVVNNVTSTPNNIIRGYPLTEFYSKEGTYYTSVLGGDDSSWIKIKSVLEELTGDISALQ